MVQNVAPKRLLLRNSISPATSIPSAPVPNATGTNRLALMLKSSALASPSMRTENPNANTPSGTPLAAASGAGAGSGAGVVVDMAASLSQLASSSLRTSSMNLMSTGLAPPPAKWPHTPGITLNSPLGM